MYTSFYTASRGVIEQQKRLDIVANNMANVSNYGYKSKDATFSELMHYNLNNAKGEETDIKAGTGVVTTRTSTNFTPGGLIPTDSPYDFAIKGKGFFRVENPTTGQHTYTRNGRFSLSQFPDGFYLVNDNGNFVLDQNAQRIRVENHVLSGKIGVYRFEVLDGMMNIGNNEYVPVQKSGNPILDTSAEVRENTLEASGVDLAEEMARVIETQRAYSFAMKMVITSDEITNTINGLRQ